MYYLRYSTWLLASAELPRLAPEHAKVYSRKSCHHDYEILNLRYLLTLTFYFLVSIQDEMGEEAKLSGWHQIFRV
jgi:hypothetical protein